MRPARLVLMALYAIFRFFFAMFNVIGFRKHGSRLLTASRAINFIADRAAPLRFEIAALDRPGFYIENFHVRMIAASGAVFCALVLVMPFVMTVRAKGKPKRIE